MLLPFCTGVPCFNVNSIFHDWLIGFHFCCYYVLWTVFLIHRNKLIVSIPGGRGALRVKISRGARFEAQDGTQQDLNKIIDLVNFGRQKDRLHAENGGLRNGTQQDLNKMVDMVKFGGGQKDCPDAENGGQQNRGAYLLTQRGSAPPHSSLRVSIFDWDFYCGQGIPYGAVKSALLHQPS